MVADPPTLTALCTRVTSALGSSILLRHALFEFPDGGRNPSTTEALSIASDCYVVHASCIQRVRRYINQSPGTCKYSVFLSPNHHGYAEKEKGETDNP
jgi:hypothetical protein